MEELVAGRDRTADLEDLKPRPDGVKYPPAPRIDRNRS